MKGIILHHQQVHRAPSSGTWPPPWSASLRGWSGDGTVRGQAWCCRHSCRKASGSQHLLSLGLGSSDLSDGLEGGVQVAGSDEVTSVEGINLAISLEVIDIGGEVDGVNLLLLKTKFSHCYWGRG